jgi:hypothetical protein
LTLVASVQCQGSRTGVETVTNDVLHSASLGRQISVFLDDEPGTLAHVAVLLGRCGVNIFALSLAEGVGHGYIRMVVDKPEDALTALHDAEELVMEREVLLLEVSNTPGSLGLVARALADAKLNLEYAYCAGGPSVDKGLIVVRVNDAKKGLEVLKKLL